MAVTLVAALAAATGVANLRQLTANSTSLSNGTVTIADSDGGTALFTLTGLRPGDTQSRCVNVTNTGNLSLSGLQLEATLTGSGLGDHLVVDVDRGSGAAAGSSSSCTGFVVQTTDLFAGTLTGFENASPVDDPGGAAAGQAISYRVSVTMPADVSQAAQGLTDQLALAWTGRS